MILSRMLSGFFAATALLLTFSNIPAESLLGLCEFNGPSGVRMTLHDEQCKGEHLSHLAQSSVERVACKDRIAEELNSGEMPLIEAAACFRVMYEDPKSWNHPSRPRPAADDAEGWCREVIEWTEMRTRVERSPGVADALRRRLEAELQEQKECQGSVTLPE